MLRSFSFGTTIVSTLISSGARCVWQLDPNRGVVGAANADTIEGFWSIFKRGVVGTFRKVSDKYLALYVAEFQFLYNNRLNPDIFGAVITDVNVMTGENPSEAVKEAIEAEAIESTPNKENQDGGKPSADTETGARTAQRSASRLQNRRTASPSESN